MLFIADGGLGDAEHSAQQTLVKHPDVERAARGAILKLVQLLTDRRADDAAVAGLLPCLLQLLERADLAYVEIVRGGLDEAFDIDAVYQAVRRENAETRRVHI